MSVESFRFFHCCKFESLPVGIKPKDVILYITSLVFNSLPDTSKFPFNEILILKSKNNGDWSFLKKFLKRRFVNYSVCLTFVADCRYTQRIRIVTYEGTIYKNSLLVFLSSSFFFFFLVWQKGRAIPLAACATLYASFLLVDDSLCRFRTFV